MLKKLFKCFWMWLLLLICSTVSAQDNDALNTIRQTYDGTEYIGAYFIRVQYLDNKYLCDNGTNTYVALYTGNAPADAATSCVWYVYKYNDNGKYRYFIQNVSTGRFFDRDYDRSDENKVAVSDYGDGYRSKLIALADATLSNLRMSLGSDDLNINEYESPEEAMNIVSYATGDITVLSVGEPGSDQLNNSYTAYISNEGKFSFGSCRFYLIADETRTPAKPKVKTNYLFAPPGTEINVTASWSGTDELAAPKWAFEYSTDGTNWTASPLEYINENVLTFDMQLQNVYVRAKITNATADMTSDGRDVSAAVLINGVNNNSAACENSASQTLLWERFDLNETSGDLSCSQQSYDGIAADYQYANGGCITNGKYAIVNNAGNGCHGKDGCIGGSNPERTWFISDYDHTGNVDDANKRIGGMLAVNFNQANAGNILNKQYELPLGTNLSLSFYVAPLTREIGTDAAGLTVYIEESEDGNDWSEVVKESHNIEMSHKSYLDWEQIIASIITSKKYARIRIHGDNSGDNGSDIVFDDISIIACRPQLEWNNITSPLNHDQDAFLLQNSKESWARAFGENKTYFMVVEIADNDGNTYYTKAEVNYGGTCTTSYPCISAEDVPVTVPFTVGDAGNVYDSNGQKVGDDFSLDKSKLYTLQAKIYTNEAAYNADNAGSAGSVIISGQSTKVKMRPSLPIKILACENRDGSAIYNGTGVQTDLETAITNSINDTDVSVTMYEGEWNYDDGGYIFSTPVLEVSIDAQHNPTFNYNTSKKIEINNGTFEKVYTLIWEYDLDGVNAPYSAQPVIITLNDLPKDLSVSTEYATQCSNAGGAVHLPRMARM
ncbi:MAG: hypothetical protein PUG15_01230 [Bacteroidales bacterium]|nr:hypothetical protein [Bacteroidales bacterium]